MLVSRYRGLVRACANRYRRSPEPTEDLVQVGYVGLLKAINNFDPGVGRNLAAYAQPCITGEIKRYFRDKRWQVHVERPVQERLLALRETSRELTQQLGHAPSDAELASDLGITEADVQEARGADLLLQPASLDAPLSGQPDTASLAELLGGDDPQMEHTLSMEALAVHWGGAAPAGAADPADALLRGHDPGGDRPHPGHLADARLPAARPRAHLPAPAHPGLAGFRGRPGAAS